MDVEGKMAALLGCVVGQVASEGRPVDMDIVIPGTAAFKIGMGKCSQAWIRLVSANPSNSVGTPESTPGNCAAGLGITLEVGIMRCWKAPKADKEPDPDELRRVGSLVVADMLSMRAALLCCDAVRSKDLILNTYRPMGPAGPDFGGAWTFQIGVI